MASTLLDRVATNTLLAMAAINCKAYKLAGRVTFRGLPISIESKKGQTRKGTGADGKPWKVTMPWDYGYIRGTEGADGQHVDCFIGPNENADEVYVIHQCKEDDHSKYDEDKVMLGFDSLQDAIKAYKSAYVGVDLFKGSHTFNFEDFVDEINQKSNRGKPLECSSDQDWVGFDLDGTLAYYTEFKGPTVIGKPILAMIKVLEQHLAEGDNVKIFTARVAEDKDGSVKKAIQDWCAENVGVRLDVTNEKDQHMVKLYDDRAATVEKNTGKVLAEPIQCISCESGDCLIHAGGPGSGWSTEGGHIKHVFNYPKGKEWKPGEEKPEVINGVPLKAVAKPDFSKLVDKSIKEPKLKAPTYTYHDEKTNTDKDFTLHKAAGVLVVEPDNKVWLYAPKGFYGGYVNTFSKGTLDKGEHPQDAAVRELHEETGIVAKITGYLGDVERSTSITRYYIGERVGGAPWASKSDETHSVQLVPLDSNMANRLRDVNGHRTADHEVLDMLMSHLEEHGQDKAPTVEKSSVDYLAKKIGGQGGSNPGGVYKGSDGVDRYVKFYKDMSQGREEATANTIYNDLGIGAPKSSVIETGTGKQAFASELIGGGKTLAQAGLTKDNCQAVLKGFAADVLTANWDAVGLVHDNILMKGGEAYRIDNGSAFTHRAQGGDKPSVLLNKITEFDGLSNPNINAEYTKVFEKAGYKLASDIPDIKQQVQNIVNLEHSSGGWENYLSQKAPYLTPKEHSTIADMLSSRTELLMQKVGIKGPKLKASADVEAGGPGSGWYADNGHVGHGSMTTYKNLKKAGYKPIGNEPGPNYGTWHDQVTVWKPKSATDHVIATHDTGWSKHSTDAKKTKIGSGSTTVDLKKALGMGGSVKPTYSNVAPSSMMPTQKTESGITAKYGAQIHKNALQSYGWQVLKNVNLDNVSSYTLWTHKDYPQAKIKTNATGGIYYTTGGGWQKSTSATYATDQIEKTSQKYTTPDKSEDVDETGASNHIASLKSAGYQAVANGTGVVTGDPTTIWKKPGDDSHQFVTTSTGMWHLQDTKTNTTFTNPDGSKIQGSSTAGLKDAIDDAKKVAGTLTPTPASTPKGVQVQVPATGKIQALQNLGYALTKNKGDSDIYTKVGEKYEVHIVPTDPTHSKFDIIDSKTGAKVDTGTVGSNIATSLSALKQQAVAGKAAAPFPEAPDKVGAAFHAKAEKVVSDVFDNYPTKAKQQYDHNQLDSWKNDYYTRVAAGEPATQATSIKAAEGKGVYAEAAAKLGISPNQVKETQSLIENWTGVSTDKTRVAFNQACHGDPDAHPGNVLEYQITQAALAKMSPSKDSVDLTRGMSVGDKGLAKQMNVFMALAQHGDSLPDWNVTWKSGGAESWTSTVNNGWGNVRIRTAVDKSNIFSSIDTNPHSFDGHPSEKEYIVAPKDYQLALTKKGTQLFAAEHKLPFGMLNSIAYLQLCGWKFNINYASGVIEFQEGPNVKAGIGESSTGELQSSGVEWDVNEDQKKQLQAIYNKLPELLQKSVTKVELRPEDYPYPGEHGEFKNGVIYFNPKNFENAHQYGQHNPTSVVEHVFTHECAHGVYEKLSKEKQEEWEKLSGWKQGHPEGNAEPYVEKRPGWEPYTADVTHSKDAQFPNEYSGKNPAEDFCDCVSYYLTGNGQQVPDDKLKFIKDLLGDVNAGGEGSGRHKEMDVEERLKEILKKPWKKQTDEERHFVALHNPNQKSLFPMKAGGKGSGWFQEDGHVSNKQKGPKPENIGKSKSQISKENYGMKVDADAQRRAENYESVLAKVLGGRSYNDTEPVDIVVRSGGRLVGVEVKTFISNKEGKITQRTPAINRKYAWAKKTGAELYTVVVDAREGGKPGCYIRQGTGAWNIKHMHPVGDMAGVKHWLQVQGVEKILPDAFPKTKAAFGVPKTHQWEKAPKSVRQTSYLNAEQEKDLEDFVAGVDLQAGGPGSGWFTYGGHIKHTSITSQKVLKKMGWEPKKGTKDFDQFIHPNFKNHDIKVFQNGYAHYKGNSKFSFHSGVTTVSLKKHLLEFQKGKGISKSSEQVVTPKKEKIDSRPKPAFTKGSIKVDQAFYDKSAKVCKDVAKLSDKAAREQLKGYQLEDDHLDFSDIAHSNPQFTLAAIKLGIPLKQAGDVQDYVRGWTGSSSSKFRAEAGLVLDRSPKANPGMVLEYQMTQAMLAQQGIKSVTLYRGLDCNSGKCSKIYNALRKGETCSLKPGGVDSWSASKGTAESFSDSTKGLLINRTFKASQVFTSYQTNKSAFEDYKEEKEFVIGFPSKERAITLKKQKMDKDYWGDPKYGMIHAEDVVIDISEPDGYCWLHSMRGKK